jgi:hypothetical protein
MTVNRRDEDNQLTQIALNTYEQPDLVFQEYGHYILGLRRLVDLVWTDGNGAGMMRTFRRAKQAGYDDWEIEKVFVFCNSLRTSDGNLDLTCLRTHNMHRQTHMPNTFSRIIARIMVEDHDLELKKLDERLLTTTPYAIFELVARTFAQTDAMLNRKRFIADSDSTLPSDLMEKVIDLVNFVRNNAVHAKRFLTGDMTLSPSVPASRDNAHKGATNILESVVDLSNRIHNDEHGPMSVAACDLLMAQIIETAPRYDLEYQNDDMDAYKDYNGRYNTPTSKQSNLTWSNAAGDQYTEDHKYRVQGENNPGSMIDEFWL